MSVPRGRCCTTAMHIPCRRRRSACRPRCICIRNGCALWRRGMKPEHPRKFGAQESSSLPEHRAAMVAAVSGRRGKRYLKRQQLLELGEPAIRYLTEIVHRRPRQWYEDVDRLHAILQSHGPEVLRRAMEAGLQQQVFGAFYVERSLQSKLNFPEVVQ